MASIGKIHAVVLFLTIVFRTSLQQCPSMCRCPSETEVRCSNKDLSVIPPDIPTTVEKLYLDRNRISEVNNSHIAAFPNLRELHLPRNSIRTVPGQTFANLPNLEILSLASNNVSVVDVYAFRNSPKLKYIFLNRNSLVEVPKDLQRLETLEILALDHNNIRTVSAELFSSQLRSLIRVDLNNNPWSCDCRLRGLKEWMSETSIEISLRENVTCASPEHLIRRAIDDVNVADMVCPTPTPLNSGTTQAATTTTTIISVNVQSTRSTIAYSSSSAKGTTTNRTTDTHSTVLSTQNHHTTGSKEVQTSRTKATGHFIAPKSTSDLLDLPSLSESNDNKDDLIWIICVSVLGAVLLIMMLTFLWFKCYHRPVNRPAIYMEDTGLDNVVYRRDGAEATARIDMGGEATGQETPDGRMPNMEDKLVTVQQLQRLAQKLGHEWEQLNYELGFSRAELYHFKTNHPHNVQQAIFEMLDTWFQQNGQEATIGRLVEQMMNIPVDVETYGFLLS
ncbi:uncharacterized protein LOC144887513 [Branchiostoma floridae x Branchiostoma japonicum]